MGGTGIPSSKTSKKIALQHTMPSAPAPSTSTSTVSTTAPYQRIVDNALAQARPLMERVAETARMSLQ